MPLFSEAEFSEFVEGLESESEGAEAAEATRRVKKASSASSFRQRPSAGTPMYVTQTQLQASLARVDGKIKTVSDGVSTINSRVTALAASFKKESEERKKALQSQNNDLNQKLQLLALLPVLVQPPTANLSGGILAPTASNPTNNSVLVQDSSSLDALLPLLLVSGLGGTSGTGGFSLGGDSSSSSDNSMMMLALVLAMSKQ
jgi:hypothetical protein